MGQATDSVVKQPTLLSGFLLDILFDPEDVGDIFLRNVG
jgi:hypothetical protein